MAARTFSEREREREKKQSLTWITGKELEREIYNNGDQFRWKKNVKFVTLGEKMRKASGYQGENERQWKIRVNRKTNISFIKRVNRKLYKRSFTF